MTDLLTWLRSLAADDWDRRPAGRWDDGDPGDADVFATAQKELGEQFPDDYRELVLASNHAALAGANESINFESIEDVADLNDQYRDSLPGMVVIGDNGGGAVYFYDPKDALGRGPWSLFWVNLGDLAVGNARFAGKTLTEVLHRIANGVAYFDEPKIRG